jgi:hypothetical protein
MRFARNGPSTCATARNGNLLQARANNFDGLAFCQGLPCGAVFQERSESVPDLSKITCIEDLRVIAQRRVPRMFYDYADSGSWTEGTYRANEATSSASSCASAWR